VRFYGRAFGTVISISALKRTRPPFSRSWLVRTITSLVSPASSNGASLFALSAPF